MTLINLSDILILLGAGAFIALIGVLAGAFVMFRGTKAVPGETMFGGVPKGQVFSIPDPLEDEPKEQSEAEKLLLEKTNKFLKVFSGGVDK